VAFVGHVGDEGADGGGADGDIVGVVGPGVDIVDGGGVESAAIFREGDTVVQLERWTLAIILEEDRN
jgi:hypothetical protein